VSENGYYVISCGQDNVIRLFEKSDELLVLEDEREEERTQDAENELATGDETNVYGGPSALALPTKKTVSAEKCVRINKFTIFNNKCFKRILIQMITV